MLMQLLVGEDSMVWVHPWIQDYIHALPTRNRVEFGHRPWAQKHIQTLSIRVGYPWVSMSMGKIAILNRIGPRPLKNFAGRGKFSPSTFRNTGRKADPRVTPIASEIWREGHFRAAGPTLPSLRRH
jgi:hypothetical protein